MPAEAAFGVGIVIATAIAAGPVAGLAWLLNARDRRERRLYAVVCRELSGAALRSDVGLEIHCGVWSRRAVVTVRYLVSSPGECWATLLRLRGALPARVRLDCDALVYPGPLTRIEIEVKRFEVIRPRPSVPLAAGARPANGRVTRRSWSS